MSAHSGFLFARGRAHPSAGPGSAAGRSGRSSRFTARGATAGLALALAAAGTAGIAGAQSGTWPERPVRVVVPFSPGGSSDVIARIIGAQITAATGQSVVVDARPGAGTSIGNAVVARATPDGYTVLLADRAFAASSSVLPNLPYDAVKDFAPVTLLGTSAQYIYSATGRYADAKAMIAAARATPAKFTVASGGTGTTTHFMVEMFKRAVGADVTHVPYKGSAPAIAETAGGQVDAVFASYASAAAMVKTGKLQTLAIAARERHPSQPTIPTFAELGVKGLVADHWWGVIAPAGVPKATLDGMNAAFARAVASEETKKRFPTLAVDPKSSTPGEYAALIRSDLELFGRIVREAGIKAK